MSMTLSEVGLISLHDSTLPQNLSYNVPSLPFAERWLLLSQQMAEQKNLSLRNFWYCSQEIFDSFYNLL